MVTISNRIDPKVIFCTGCGLSWKPKLRHKLVMLIFGEYTRTCPQCSTRMTFRLINHVVKVDTETIKNRSEVYKNG